MLTFFIHQKKKITIKNIFIPSRISSWKGHEILLNYFSLLDQKYKDMFNIHIISLNQSKEEKKNTITYRQIEYINKNYNS